MKITIDSSGEDENDDFNVAYVMQAENKNFKGTIEFYEFDNCFKEFATELLQFPFESQQPVRFEADGVKITVLLDNQTGVIRISINLGGDGDSLRFSDTSVEVEDLHRLAKMLLKNDFSKRHSISWESV